VPVTTGWADEVAEPENERAMATGTAEMRARSGARSASLLMSIEPAQMWLSQVKLLSHTGNH